MRPNTQIFTFRVVWNALWRERAPLQSYAVAILLALGFIVYLFPLTFLAGHGAFFDKIDASQHVSGWLFYVRDDWHFPLLHTERLNHPAGVSIAFTDSIPLAALLFKSIRFLLHEGFHYIGWWHAVAFLAQAMAATFLMRALGVRHWIGTFCATVFALMWPELLWRLGHTSLMTQGLLLFAAGAYFLGRSKQWSNATAASVLIGTCAVGLMVHPYLMAFCYALFLAFLTDEALSGAGVWRQARWLLVSVAVIAVLGLVLGYFGSGTTTTGFGFYSMNLNAPVCGGRLLPCLGSPTHHQFEAYNFADATGGQYEGFNYFGAGLLLLLPFALVAKERALFSLPIRYPALILACALLTWYALSNKVYFGGSEILSYDLPSVFDKLIGTFRASGRFFWVVGYLILFATLATLLRTPSWRGLLVLCVALPLQWIDTQPLRQRVIDIAGGQGTNDVALWQKAMAGIDKLHIYPAYGCHSGDDSVYWFFQKVSAYYGKLIDTGYIARANVDCERNARSFDANLEQGHLYVMSVDFLKNPFAVPLGLQTAAQRGECVRWREAVLCKAGANEAYWHQTGLQVTTVPPFDKHQLHWTAGQLATLIGTVRDGRLVPAQTTRTGFLSYGPYITLSPGRYHYVIRYASASEGTREVGHWDVVAGTEKNTQTFGAGPLQGSRGVVTQLEGDFNVERWISRLEIRTQFNGGDLQLIDVSLEKQAP